MTIATATARVLGQVESEIYAGRFDVEQGVQYMIRHCNIDVDDLKIIRERLRETAKEAGERG